MECLSIIYDWERGDYQIMDNGAFGSRMLSLYKYIRSEAVLDHLVFQHSRVYDCSLYVDAKSCCHLS